MRLRPNRSPSLPPIRAPTAAPKALGPRAASSPTMVLLMPRYSCHSASPAARATMDPASKYDAMPARTVHFHCWPVTWLSSCCLFTSSSEVAMIQVYFPPARRFRPTSPISVATLPLFSLPFSYALHVGPEVLESFHMRPAGVGRHHQADLRDVVDDAESPLFELPAVNEQHGSLGVSDHRFLDLGFEWVDVREISFGCDPLDAQEGPVRHVRLDRVYRARSHKRECERTEDPPKPHHTPPRGICVGEEVHYRHQVGQEGDTRRAGQDAPRRVVRRGRRVDKHPLIRPKQRRSGAGQTLLLLYSLTQPLLEGVLVLREPGRNRPAMGPLDLPLTFEQREIPPRSRSRDAKLLLQPGHRATSRLADAHRYPLLTLLRYICASIRHIVIDRAVFVLNRSNPSFARSYCNGGCNSMQACIWSFTQAWGSVNLG